MSPRSISNQDLKSWCLEVKDNLPDPESVDSCREWFEKMLGLDSRSLDAFMSSMVTATVKTYCHLIDEEGEDKVDAFTKAAQINSLGAMMLGVALERQFGRKTEVTL